MSPDPNPPSASEPAGVEGDATVVHPPGEAAAHAPPLPPRPHVLEMVRGPGAPTTFVLGRHEVVIGRSSDADLHIADETLSRRHARLTRVHDSYHCRDEESRNGLFLNGIKIQSAVLRDGDALQIGGVVLVYHEGS